MMPSAKIGDTQMSEAPSGTWRARQIIPSVKPVKTKHPKTGSIAMERRPSKPWNTMCRSSLVQGRCNSRASASIPRGFMLCGSLVVSVLLAAMSSSSQAAQRIRGTVLAVASSTDTAVVAHDAFAGMPSMTMAFKIIPRSAITRLRTGDLIEATVSRQTEPWTLSNISIQTNHAAAPVNIIRDVKPLQVGDSVPQTKFVDQTGHSFTFSNFLGHPVVLAFVYTRCRDPRMCPLISAKFNQLQERFRSTQTHLVEITLDPEYDRPPVLAAYGRTFGAQPGRWSLGTGNPEEVLNFAAAFGLNVFADQKLGLIHAERTAIVDPGGRLTTLIDDPGWSSGDIVAEVNAQSHQAANPLARVNLALSKAAVAVCGDRVAGFSGLLDLAVALLIFGSFGWVFFRLGRAILTSKA